MSYCVSDPLQAYEELVMFLPLGIVFNAAAVVVAVVVVAVVAVAVVVVVAAAAAVFRRQLAQWRLTCSCWIC